MKGLKFKIWNNFLLDEKLILKQFSHFGKIILLEKFEDDRTSSLDYIIIYETITPKKYELILKNGVIIQKKKLRLEKFDITNLEEMKDRAAEEKRKVCVYFIPKTFKSRKLKKIFNYQFGNVDTAFIRKTKSNDYNYGFVKFTHKKHAERALKQKFVKIKIGEQYNELNSEESKNSNSENGEEVSPENIELEIRKFIIKPDHKISKNYLRKLIENYMKKEKQENNESTHIQQYQIDKFLFFLPPWKRESYLKNLLKDNTKLDKEELPKLELFYFNKHPSYIKNEKDSIGFERSVLKMSKIVDENHHFYNLRKNWK